MYLDPKTPTPHELRRLVDSTDWWVIPVASYAAIVLLKDLVTACYADAGPEDFHLVMVPALGPNLPPMTVGLAHKRRCSPEQVAALLPEAARSHLGDHDILVAEDKHGTLALKAALALGDWVYPEGEDGHAPDA